MVRCSRSFCCTRTAVDGQRPRAAARGSARDGAKRGRPAGRRGSVSNLQGGAFPGGAGEPVQSVGATLTQLTRVTFGPQTVIGEQLAGRTTTRSAPDGGELANRSALRRVPSIRERPDIEVTACGFAA
jgi:hypothetical protein